MTRFTLIAATIATMLFAGAAGAATYNAHSFSSDEHSVWLPGLDQRHLHFNDGATFTMEDDAWNLKGDLTSGTDGSSWSIEVDFSNIYSGSAFGELTGYDNGRLKGTTWDSLDSNWAFAESVNGTIRANSGVHEGRVFTFERMPGSNDYYAQFGTCLNDKNCEVGLSSWITLTDQQTLETYRGDININVSNPVPEPSAALVFGLGTVIASAVTRRRTA